MNNSPSSLNQPVPSLPSSGTAPTTRLNSKILKRFRLRTVLVVPFIILIVVSTGLVGWFSFRNGQRAINDLATQLITF